MLKAQTDLGQHLRGFTLIELLVTVSIIGLLLAVAIPSYQRYQMVARQAEAKVSLASAYTIESGFYAEQQHYTACLGAAGYSPSSTNRYYTSGFHVQYLGSGFAIAESNAECPFPCGRHITYDPDAFTGGRAPATVCPDDNGQTHFLATHSVAPDIKTDRSNLPRNGYICKKGFAIFASGSIGLPSIAKDSNGNDIPNFDHWMVDHNKNVAPVGVLPNGSSTGVALVAGNPPDCL